MRIVAFIIAICVGQDLSSGKTLYSLIIKSKEEIEQRIERSIIFENTIIKKKCEFVLYFNEFTREYRNQVLANNICVFSKEEIFTFGVDAYIEVVEAKLNSNDALIKINLIEKPKESPATTTCFVFNYIKKNDLWILVPN